MKNNLKDKRKKILQNISNKGDVDNKTKGLYGLTAYYDKENLDSTIAEKIYL